MSCTTSSDDDDAPPPQSSGVFTRSGSGGRGAANAAFADEAAQLLQAEQRLTRAVAEQTRLTQALESRLVRRGRARRQNCAKPHLSAPPALRPRRPRPAGTGTAARRSLR